MTRTFVLENPSSPDTIMMHITLTYTSIDLPAECKPARKLKNPVPALCLGDMLKRRNDDLPNRTETGYRHSLQRPV